MAYRIHIRGEDSVEYTCVNEQDFDANTILKADSNDTPEALTIGEQEVVGRVTGGEIDGLPIGIADNNIVQIDSTSVATGEYAKFTASGLESKTPAEVTSDLTEAIQDLVGGMVSGNTETFIGVTYQDGDGTLDFVVPVKDEDDMASNSDTHLATQKSIKAYADGISTGSAITALAYAVICAN
jgi:hypothetical protein